MEVAGVLGGNGTEFDKVTEARINTGYYRSCLVVTSACAKWCKSSPTISALFAVLHLRVVIPWVVLFVGTTRLVGSNANNAFSAGDGQHPMMSCLLEDESYGDQSFSG